MSDLSVRPHQADDVCSEEYGRLQVIDETPSGDPSLRLKLQETQQEYYCHMQEMLGFVMDPLTIGIYGRKNWPTATAGFPYGITNYSVQRKEIFSTQQDIKKDIYVPFFVKFLSGRLTQQQLDQMANAFHVEPRDNIKDVIAQISEEDAYDQYATHYGLMNEMGLHAVAQAGLTDRLAPGLDELVAALIRQTLRTPTDREQFGGMDELVSPFIESSERFVWNQDQVIHDPEANQGPLGVVEYAWFAILKEREFAMKYAPREGFTRDFVAALQRHPQHEITHADFVRIIAETSGENLDTLLAGNDFLNTLYHDPAPLTCRQQFGRPFQRTGKFLRAAWQLLTN